MTNSSYRVRFVGGERYAPFLSCLVSASPLSEPSPVYVESYIRITNLHHRLRSDYVDGARGFHNVVAAQFRGDSMTGDNVSDGDIGLFVLSREKHSRLWLIQKIGYEEGTAALALKKLVETKPRSWRLDGFGETSSFDEREVKLLSSNPAVPPIQLDPAGQYLDRGYLAQTLRPWEVEKIPASSLPETCD